MTATMTPKDQSPSSRLLAALSRKTRHLLFGKTVAERESDLLFKAAREVTAVATSVADLQSKLSTMREEFGATDDVARFEQRLYQANMDFHKALRSLFLSTENRLREGSVAPDAPGVRLVLSLVCTLNDRLPPDHMNLWLKRCPQVAALAGVELQQPVPAEVQAVLDEIGATTEEKGPPASSDKDDGPGWTPVMI